MTCIECKHWMLRGSPLAKHGLGNCPNLPAQTYRPSNAPSCDGFETAEAKVVTLRQAALDQSQSELRAALSPFEPLKGE
jgi:hypothetical protein